MTPKPSPSDPLRIISGLAQELDAPLKSVLTRTQKLINDYKARDFEFISYKDFKVIFATLEKLERQLAHCSQTTTRMLYVGKRQAHLQEDQTSINAVIETIAGDMSAQLKSARIKLSLQLGKSLPAVALGPVECHQIIHNILINAIQAMPGGGVIKLKTSLNKAGMVGIDVTDEGVGITPEHLPKVFEPFFTTKEHGIDKNAGLGLSIIYAIINASGGSIHIKSSLRKGTTVQVSLPVFKSK